METIHLKFMTFNYQLVLDMVLYLKTEVPTDITSIIRTEVGDEVLEIREHILNPLYEELKYGTV